MRKALVTGSNGYIGRHVVKALVDEGVHVMTLDRSEMTGIEGVETYVGDIFSPEFDLRGLLSEVPDVCIHLAWRNGFVHNDLSHMLDLSGHFRFLNNAIDAGVHQIAVMGTMHEVGYWEGEIREDTPCNPTSFYGIAKDTLRRSFLQLAHDRDVVAQWLRGFYIYGDDERSQSIFGKIVRAAQSGQTHFPFTTGRNKYDFIKVDDLARQIAACSMQDEVNGIINCCSGIPVSLADQIESFIKIRGLDITLDYGTYPDRPYDSPAVWGNADKIKQIMKESDCY